MYCFQGLFYQAQFAVDRIGVMEAAWINSKDDKEKVKNISLLFLY